MTYRSRTTRYRTKYEQMKELGYEFTVDARSTLRRLEALQAIGWSLTEIGKMVGKSQQCLSEIGHPRKRVMPKTARDIAEVYERLHMTPNTTPYSPRTRAYAAKRGYAPPLAWDDIDNDKYPIKGYGREGFCRTNRHPMPGDGRECVPCRSEREKAERRAA